MTRAIVNRFLKLSLPSLMVGAFFTLVCPVSAFQEQGQQKKAEQSSETAPASNDQSVEHPLTNDRTGIEWVFSLDAAIEKAKLTNRIVLLKPVAYRSKAGSDALSPSAEALRAVSLVDSRVVNFINRRFVPYYFDMDKMGSQYDENASKLAINLHPELGYFSAMPTPPLLLMTPERKMLGYVSNFLGPDELMKRIGEILDENSDYKMLNADERAIQDPVKKARVYYELRQLDKAMELLDQQSNSEAYYLRGLIAREQQDWPQMKASFKMVTEQSRMDDIDIEIGIRYWTIKNYEGLKAKFATIRKDHPRYQEAMYYLGLAYFLTNDPDRCMEIWEQAIETDRKSAWAFRLDWSLGLAKLGPDQFITAYQSLPSVLGRKYMSPDGNPDMKRR